LQPRSISLFDYKLISKDRSLRGFFGCLTTGLDYIHRNAIRHKDIKPENILIKGDTVLYTDFGIALDWKELGRSTTQDTSLTMTRRYSAPEMLMDAPRNSSADVWALGCIFLEVTTVLKKRTVSDLRAFLESFGTQSTVYSMNHDGVLTWVDQLVNEDEHVSDNIPLEWVRAIPQEETCISSHSRGFIPLDLTFSYHRQSLRTTCQPLLSDKNRS
jgi:hypothetical protein